MVTHAFVECVSVRCSLWCVFETKNACVRADVSFSPFFSPNVTSHIRLAESPFRKTLYE